MIPRAALYELVVGGTAYWLVERDPVGRVVSVEYVPLDRLRPSWRHRRPFWTSYERWERVEALWTLSVVAIAAVVAAFLAWRPAP